MVDNDGFATLGIYFYSSQTEALKCQAGAAVYPEDFWSRNQNGSPEVQETQRRGTREDGITAQKPPLWASVWDIAITFTSGCLSWMPASASDLAGWSDLLLMIDC